MDGIGTLNINGCDATNKDIIVTYVPNAFVTSYQFSSYETRSYHCWRSSW